MVPLYGGPSLLVDSSKFLQKADDAWARIQSLGPEYMQSKIENHDRHAWTTSAEQIVPQAERSVEQSEKLIFQKVVRVAFWKYFDITTEALLQRSSDPKAFARFRKVQQDVIRFSQGEFRITQEAVQALAGGSPMDIQRIESKMDAALCDFRTAVDDHAFPPPEELGFLFHMQPHCGN